ncbi:MAG: hypothetical protein A2X94_12150 [Bdellovibrionales bacterium GWB1_55_8]|nr:MAG: hypothetical protein A2X94_12150 [Bdellovibrionales bacterium GWB1_55_8]
MICGDWTRFSKWGVTDKGFPWLDGRERRAFFLYDTATIINNTNRVREIWQPLSSHEQSSHAQHLFYSIKANPNGDLIRFISNSVDGFDVSSGIELRALLELGIQPQRITLSGPAKTDECLELAIHAGIHAIHLDSVEEYQAIRGLMKASTRSPGMTLRVPLNDPLSQKLGLPESDLIALLSRAVPGEFAGFHAYLGRESFSEELCIGMLHRMQDLLRAYPAAFGKEFAVYLGPGLPAKELQEQRPFQHSAHQPFPFPIHFEGGRTLISDAGCYGAPILSVKRGLGGLEQIVIVDGGFQHVASSLPSPVFSDRAIACLALRGSGILTTETTPTDVFGSLSLSHDALLSRASLPSNLQRGDWLLFSPCGAYGYTTAANQFIGHPQPEEWLLKSNSPSPVSANAAFRPYHFSFPRTEVSHD